MKITLEHVTRFEYSAEVVEGVMEVRLGPLSDYHQRWDRFDLVVRPSASTRRYSDGFGNRTHLVTLARPHQALEVVTRGEVVTMLENPFAPPAKRPTSLTPAELADYLPPSAMIPAHAGLAELAAPYRPAAADATFDAVRALCTLVHQSFEYRRHVTTVATTVDDVLRLRGGVCQDFAHVLVGLCRAVGVPARYVSGYTLGGDGPNGEARAVQPGDAPQRAQASHAWAEAFIPTHGWRGFDATNDVVAGLSHVKVAMGRDYGDVPPTRGSFRGTAAQTLTVSVESRAGD